MKKRDDHSTDLKVCIARKHLRVAEDQFHADPTEKRRMSVEERKKDFCAGYTEASEKSLMEKIMRADNAADTFQEIWMIINEITSRKRELKSDPGKRV